MLSRRVSLTATSANAAVREVDDGDQSREDKLAFIPPGCCRLLDPRTESSGSSNEFEDIPTGHFWMWCVVGTTVYCACLMAVQGAQTYLTTKKVRMNLTAANYAVMISNVHGSTGDDAKLEEFGQQWGSVVMAFHIRSVGLVLTWCNSVRAALCLLLCSINQHASVPCALWVVECHECAHASNMQLAHAATAGFSQVHLS